eukprot:7452487-Pyramimonas_sp.AAC.1
MQYSNTSLKQKTLGWRREPNNCSYRVAGPALPRECKHDGGGRAPRNVAQLSRRSRADGEGVPR